MPIRLSPNFTLGELLYSDTAMAEGIDNRPDGDGLVQLYNLANITLEGIRALCGGLPLYISSGYRCEELNDAVGGASDSAHLYGCAADFTIPDYANGDVAELCRYLSAHLEHLEIDQLINETGGGARWVHVGRCIPPGDEPRCECLTITNGETITGIA